MSYTIFTQFITKTTHAMPIQGHFSNLVRLGERSLAGIREKTRFFRPVGNLACVYWRIYEWRKIFECCQEGRLASSRSRPAADI